jgi:hypothetical protein
MSISSSRTFSAIWARVEPTPSVSLQPRLPLPTALAWTMLE